MIRHAQRLQQSRIQAVLHLRLGVDGLGVGRGRTVRVHGLGLIGGFERALLIHGPTDERKGMFRKGGHYNAARVVAYPVTYVEMYSATAKSRRKVQRNTKQPKPYPAAVARRASSVVLSVGWQRT